MNAETRAVVSLSLLVVAVYSVVVAVVFERDTFLLLVPLELALALVVRYAGRRRATDA